MSQNQARNFSVLPPSRKVLERKHLTKTETKYLDWNSNLKVRLINLTEGAEGPGMFTPNPPGIKSVFAIQPPQKVLPSSLNNNNSTNWKYYRPVTTPGNFSNNRQSTPTLEVVAANSVDLNQPKFSTEVPKALITTANSSVQNATEESIKFKNVVASKPDCQTRPSSALTSCLKTKVKSKIAKPAIASKSKTKAQTIVTFSPDTVIYQRENKPKKPRAPKKNRKPRFAHPCCGHFLPPYQEVVQFLGPLGLTEQSDNYTRFTAVWCHPSDRTSKETENKWLIRQKRFAKLLSDLSDAHHKYNTLPDKLKSICMIREILPRYIVALDIALMDADLGHSERLVSTIMTTVRVLQVTLHDEFFLPNGDPRPMPSIPDGCGYLADLGLVICALNRISGERARQDVGFLSIEPVLVKLQLELFCLVICPMKSLMFRCIVAVIPHTVSRVAHLLKEIKAADNAAYYIKWVNNSVMLRDYMAILKDFGMVDHNGAKSEVPPFITPMNVTECRIRPVTADAILTRSTKN